MVNVLEGQLISRLPSPSWCQIPKTTGASVFEASLADVLLLRCLKSLGAFVYSLTSHMCTFGGASRQKTKKKDTVENVFELHHTC